MIAVAMRRPAYVMNRVEDIVKILPAASSVMHTPSLVERGGAQDHHFRSVF